MDNIQKHFYQLKFRIDYLSKRGMEFQDWFVRLAGFAISGFIAVKPHGSSGDYKSDGWDPATRTVFQCYAPYTMDLNTLLQKIREDFTGAKEHWNLARWVFVHNDERGLPPAAVQLLDELRTDSIAIEEWTESEIHRLLSGLSLEHHEILFGVAPSATDFHNLTLQEITEVLDALVQANPSYNNEEISPPSLEKISKNSLSDDAVALLSIGRRKEPLLDRFLQRRADVTFGERIAEGFRTRYMELKTTSASSDEILSGLQSYAGGVGASPKRQAAALAIISYFFERCDIFEDG